MLKLDMTSHINHCPPEGKKGLTTTILDELPRHTRDHRMAAATLNYVVTHRDSELCVQCKRASALGCIAFSHCVTTSPTLLAS